MPNILISAGEASGDAYGAALAKAIRGLLPEAHFQGIGGRRMREAGVDLLGDSSLWGVIGIIESLRVAPKIFRDSRPLVKMLKSAPPGLFIPIDFGYLNVGLCRLAKKLGWKILYFAPPGSWRRTKQGGDLPHLTDAIVTQFSWSADILSEMGAPAYWFGHPLKELIGHQPGAARDSIAILPGSRPHEVAANLGVIGNAVSGLGMPLEIAMASSLGSEAFQSTLEAKLTPNDTYGVLSRARAGVVCSGTATLEAAICGCPHVVVYRGSGWMNLEYKIRKPKFEFISLPNILLQRSVLPELIQDAATPEAIHDHLAAILGDSDARQKQLDAFAELDALLGPSEGISAAANLAVRLVKNQPLP